MGDFLETLSNRVLVFDGAMGTQLQGRASRLDVSRDFLGHEGCNEILCRTQPEVVAEVHESFLAAGADAVETNSFGANAVVLGEYGLAGELEDLNVRAASIARSACDRFATPDRPRFVVGAMGPGTKLPSLGHVDFDTLIDSYRRQAAGLLEGGADVLLLETCQDMLQVKAGIVGVGEAVSRSGLKVRPPLMVQVTIEPGGAMLLGTEIEATLAILDPYDQVDVIGINCAAGPGEMNEHVRRLCRCSRRPVSVQPNAGLPRIVAGRTVYPLSPAEMAKWAVRFVTEDGVAIVGGCCGTTPEHIRAIVDAVAGQGTGVRGQGSGEEYVPQVASLYGAIDLVQTPRPLIVGERANANGSKTFRDLLAAGDFDGMVAVALRQAGEGSHVIDVCTAMVGRDESADMAKLVSRLAVESQIPLMIDSTDPGVLERALKLVGGRAVINSINLEAGPDRLIEVCRLARRFGAAVVALAIDEEGMAKSADRKLAVAGRVLDLALSCGLRPADILFDMLTFTLASGDESLRRAGIETLDAISRAKGELPGCLTLLGVSNISFGLPPAGRVALNSVFLHEAIAAGLDAAIVHAGRILPLGQIDPEARRLARNLVFDHSEGGQPLGEFIKFFEKGAERQAAARTAPVRSVQDRLKQRIVRGERCGLEADLDEALKTHKPLEIINDVLLVGMKEVGASFGAGQMQLPFVLRSAETMKAAVGLLQRRLGGGSAHTRGHIVLATVAGDVHDIGKNLVDIILSNNGYKVSNLGIKQPIGRVIEAANRAGADAIGLSGLLVKSVQVMGEDLEELNRRGERIPVLLGGAALTRDHVENELASIYRGKVFYVADAFDALRVMDSLMAEKEEHDGPANSPALTGGPQPPPAERLVEARAALAMGADADAVAESAMRASSAQPDGRAIQARIRSPLSLVNGERSWITPVSEPPVPPFWGARVVSPGSPGLSELAPLLNEAMLFRVHWGFRRQGMSAEQFRDFLSAEVRPILAGLIQQCERERIIRPAAVYGYWPANSDGDRLIVFDPEDPDRELAEFEFPRQRAGDRLCLADYFLPASSGRRDVVAFQAATAGGRVSRVEKDWFAAGRFRDYLFLHGLGVEIADALAEFVHRLVCSDLGLTGQGGAVRGRRYGFGFPACPELADQAKLWPLLTPGRIGVRLTGQFQLDPEQSTTAMIVHHPQAVYFGV